MHDIARAAGVTKGTFYFHFARKDEILLEIGRQISDATLREAQGKVHTLHRTPEDMIEELVSSLGRRVRNSPSPAIARALAHAYEPGTDNHHTWGGRFGFQNAFAIVVAHSQLSGKLPDAIDCTEIATMLAAVTIGSIHAWLRSASLDLEAMLRSGVRTVIAGARADADSLKKAPVHTSS